MSKIEEEIKAALGGILDMASREEAEAYASVASNKAVKNALEHALAGRYEEFDYELLHPFESVVDGLLATITQSSEAKFLIKHSGFVERHFEALIEKYEGSPCCADKSRTIIRSLIRFYLEGKHIQFNYAQEYSYHLPKRVFKTHDEIVGFAQGLHHLFYGKPDFYLKALQGIATTTGAK